MSSLFSVVCADGSTDGVGGFRGIEPSPKGSSSSSIVPFPPFATPNPPVTGVVCSLTSVEIGGGK